MKEIDVLTAYNNVKANDQIALIDVRTADEFEAGHAVNAIHIELDEIINNVERLKKYQTIYFICQSGNRSGFATQLALLNDIKAYNVVGGTNEWITKKLPLE